METLNSYNKIKENTHSNENNEQNEINEQTPELLNNDINEKIWTLIQNFWEIKAIKELTNVLDKVNANEINDEKINDLKSINEWLNSIDKKVTKIWNEWLQLIKSILSSITNNIEKKEKDEDSENINNQINNL